MIPKKYEMETDYRKIPREYLNKNIPQGRGMAKWRPFATMSEQYQKLDEYMESQNKIDMPILSDEQIEQVNDAIIHYYNNKSLATIHYWKNGYIYEILGYIIKFDTFERYILIKDNNTNKILNIPFSSLYSII
ncbi:YolD-like family protein [Staphylococcus epidermidis]|nr:YolD-like family protein [Staphylococcus epidermidis]MCG2186655.1 YolD-like family protein [Staphylococcus epidermidis]HCX9496691.1 YolD-like family protein [Staphylococcus aureus]HCX9497101.1 YolD-like family protein [Staphylococcus aureus]HDH6993618.1 YolD-like family protein [Staphylococcus aureus]